MRLRVGMLALPLLATAALLLLAFPAHAAPGEAEYVGSETCIGCHDGKEAQLATTPHGRSEFARLSAHGCETCHGAGSLHAEDPDNLDVRLGMARFSAKEQAAICLNCHDGGNRFFWKGGRHEARSLACQSCHSIHSPKSEKSQLQKESTMEQCLSCHKDLRADLWKNSHHPVREGRITCTDCHNPHGTATPKMIMAASVNDQCYSCHTEKRGPFLWEHAPVRENCLTCHTPHGSNHLKLQRTSVPYLCQQCHSNTRHPGTLYDASRLPTDDNPATGVNRIFNRACVDCHAAIHGSNHPSAPYLGH